MQSEFRHSSTIIAVHFLVRNSQNYQRSFPIDDYSKTWDGTIAPTDGYAKKPAQNETGNLMTSNCQPLPRATQEQITSLAHLLCGSAGENLVGVYVHGSLAMGCFNPLASDIDLLMITRRPLPAQTNRQILGGLLQLSGSPHPVEISVVHSAQISPWHHPTPFDLHYSEVWRAAAQETLASDPDATLPSGEDGDLAGHFTVLARRGCCLAGAPIATLQLAVPWNDYLDSVRSDFAWAVSSAQADPIYRVLNACRCWAAVIDGIVLSKAEGGAWAKGRVPTRFHPLLARACAAYSGEDIESALKDTEAHAFHRWIADQLGW